MRRGSWDTGRRFGLATSMQNSYNSQLTEWIQSGERVGLLAWVSPVFPGWISILSLLPVEAPALPVVIASCCDADFPLGTTDSQPWHQNSDAIR